MEKLIIGYLYPELMNTYGDNGNILCLQKRCEWRDISVEIRKISIGDYIPKDVNLIFFGGGQDREQVLVAQDLPSKAQFIKKFVENGLPMLAICGGYQLLGKFYKDQSGEILPGIGLFNIETHAGTKRMIGNTLSRPGQAEMGEYLVGFENHSGKTFLGEEMQPLAKVTHGFGNNGEDGFEGCVYKNAVGTYMHGSLLPKNPKLADFLIEKALGITLEPLKDTLENNTNSQLVARFK